MSMEWFRWWHGTSTDPKFQRVAKMTDCTVAEVIAVWARLLEHASVTHCDASVTRGDVGKFNCDDHDVSLGIEEGKSQKIYDAFIARGLIAESRIAKWDERQPKREDPSKERTKAYRERLKEKRNHDGKDESVTHCDADVTPCNAEKRLDTDTDTDTEEIRDKPLKEKSLDPQKKESATTDEKIMGSRLPENWELPVEWKIWAVGKRQDATESEIILASEAFATFWQSKAGKDARKTNWYKTWQNWVISESRILGKSKKQNGGASHGYQNNEAPTSSRPTGRKSI